MQAHAIVAAVLALALAGCQTTTSAPPPAAGATKIDAKIAEVSATLAKQCRLVAVAIVAGESFSHNAKVDQALAAAEAARQRFCAAPPSDTATAIATLADMAIAVNAALAQARS